MILHFLPPPRNEAGVAERRLPRPHARAGMTLMEVTLAIAIFSLASGGFLVAYQMLNLRSARVRCDAVASAILRAKVAKALTDPWIPQTTPVDCVVTSGQVQTTADPNDPYDVGPTVTLITQNSSPTTGLVTGTIYRHTYAFEAPSKTVVIDYQLTYVFCGTTYNVYASTIRAEDK